MADTLFPHASAPAPAPGRMDSLPAASTWEETARAALAENATLKLEAHRRANELADARNGWRKQERAMLADAERLGLEAHSLRLQLKGCTDAKEDAVRRWQSAEEAVGTLHADCTELSEQLEAVRAAKKARDEGVAAEKAEVKRLREAIERREEFTREQLKSVAAVRSNILRGVIALPEEYVSKTDTDGPWAKLEAERDQLRKWVAEGEARLVEAKAEAAKATWLKQRCDGSEAYTVDLQRIIEDLCHGREIRTPKTGARHHFEMAQAFFAARSVSSPQANSSADKLRLIREFVALVTEEGAR